jgi:CheY-like chemotaxis protein
VLHNEGTYDEALLLAIALTAYAGEYDQQQALAASFQCHLAKPIEPEALVKAIVALIS